MMNCNWPQIIFISIFMSLCNMIHKEMESISPPLKSNLHCVICFGQRDIRKCDIGRGRKSACLMSLIFCCPETTCEEAQASLLRRRDQVKQER